ncbi:MAG: sulfatase [Kiritimatiellaeota bacterium]|nr:sulfatase [Kiritimatiellota bacterium]
MTRPNILYLHSHDTGCFVQPYGHAVPAPHLQTLAEQGVLFRFAFNGGPTCSPSRACLLTGMDAHSNGMLGLAHRGFGLRDCRQHLVHALRGVGYHTALAGVQHVARDANRIGYDRILGPPPAAERVACEFFESSPPAPFFLSVGFQETHRPYPEPGPAEDPRFCRPPPPLPDTPETRFDMASFKASVRILDGKMGRVLAALDRAGFADDTLVICTTDHGIAFPRMKCNLTDPGIHVMLLMRGPGGFHGGKAIDGLVSQVDIFPTLCELLDIEPPTWLQGVSFLPLVRGETDEVRSEIRSEINYHAAYEPQRCIRTRRYKYIRRFGERRNKVILPNCDDSPSKTIWMECGWADSVQDEEMLFDLVFDPHEAHNLAADPSRADVLDEMRARLTRWMRDTDDPLLHGDVPAARGARVNDPDGVSPDEPVIAVGG